MRVAPSIAACVTALALTTLTLGARAEDDPVSASSTSLVVEAKGKAKVTVRGAGFERSGELRAPLQWPAGAPVLVRVDFGPGDFYEAFFELGAGPYLLKVPEQKGGALLAGKRKIPLSRGVAVTSYAKDKAWSFAAAESPDGLPTYGTRYLAADKPGVRVEQVILHATLAATARAAFEALVANSLSTHLLVERDGTVIQALDLDACAYHAGDRNNRSVGIDLVGEMPNLAARHLPIDLTLPPEEPVEDDLGMGDGVEGGEAGGRPVDPNAGVTDALLVRPIGWAVINGVLTQSYGFSARATRALEGVLLALWRAYPELGRQMPAELGLVADPAVPGVLAHWQTESFRWDPGPGFDRARIARLAALVAALGAP